MSGNFVGNMPMNVGICKITLRLPENSSLKGKRQVLKSIISRIQNRFNAAVAEIDGQDSWHTAVIGVCCISNDRRFTNRSLSKVVDFVADSHIDAEMLDYEIEILTV